MRVDLFDYHLPEELIAQHPAPERDQSRLLVLDRSTRQMRDSHFSRLAEHLVPGDLLVVNDTKVIPARLTGRKSGTGGRVEVFLIRRQNGDRWESLIRPARKVYPGTVIEFGDGELTARFLKRLPDGTFLVQLRSDGDLNSILDRVGQTPLPPYIKRAPDELDKIRYQCVYAEREGSVAAPTAGLHFTPSLLSVLNEIGVKLARITLHVGLGTFLPVKTETVEEHHMHSEMFEITCEAAEAINSTRERGGRVVAVGTTTVRTLETVADQSGKVRPCSGSTDIFIYPGYEFKAVDALITNFHLPRSTLLMLVCAFADREFILSAYEHAVAEKYRFYSYGDAMLIL